LLALILGVGKSDFNPRGQLDPMFRVEGIYVSIISPFTKNYALDVEGFREHIRAAAESKLEGMVVAGTNGEFSSLSTEERKTLYKCAVDGSQGKRVVCNVGCEGTEETISLARRCGDIGADALMITPPYFAFPTDEGIIKHYEAIAEAVDLPIILFNIPYYGHPNLTPELVHRLTEIDNIVGLKESNTSINQLIDQIEINGGRISVMSGLGANFLPAMAAGAKGLITTWPEFIPETANQLHELIKKGDLKAATELQIKVARLARSMGDAPKIKAGFELVGKPAGPPRLPLLPATKQEKQRIRDALTGLGVEAKN
jgi:4-hydroxy-tetrahydrodipicolinate synthase